MGDIRLAFLVCPFIFLTIKNPFLLAEISMAHMALRFSCDQVYFFAIIGKCVFRTVFAKFT